MRGASLGRDFPCMAFNLKKVLKALLLSSSQPLAIKDIQAAFTRFHEQASLLSTTDAAIDEPVASDVAAAQPDEVLAANGDGSAAAATPPAEPAEVTEVVADSAPQDPE